MPSMLSLVSECHCTVLLMLKEYEVELTSLDLQPSTGCTADKVEIVDLDTGKVLAGPYCGALTEQILGGVRSGRVRVVFTSDAISSTTASYYGFSMRLTACLQPTSTLATTVPELDTSTDAANTSTPSTVMTTLKNKKASQTGTFASYTSKRRFYFLFTFYVKRTACYAFWPIGQPGRKYYFS